MAPIILHYALLGIQLCLSPASGLPGPALFIRETSNFDQIGKESQDTLQERALQIVASPFAQLGLSSILLEPLAAFPEISQVPNAFAAAQTLRQSVTDIEAAPISLSANAPGTAVQSGVQNPPEKTAWTEAPKATAPTRPTRLSQRMRRGSLVLSGIAEVPASTSIFGESPSLALPTAHLSTALPGGLRELLSLSMSHLPSESSLGQQDVLEKLLLESDTAQPTSFVPDVDSPPPVPPSIVPLSRSNARVGLPDPPNDPAPNHPGDTPPLSLLQPTPSLMGPKVPITAMLALPVNLAITPITAEASISKSSAVPPFEGSIADMSSALPEIPVASSPLPNLSVFPSITLSTLVLVNNPTSLPSLALPIASLSSASISEPPVVSSVRLPDNFFGSPSLVESLIAHPTLEAPVVGQASAIEGSSTLASSLPILGGLPIVTFSPALANNLASAVPISLSTDTFSTSPATRPSIIEHGTIYDKTYTWTFFRSGVVRVDASYLVPIEGRFVGFLPDDTLVGLFVDGLHIGEHIIPYPAAYLSLLIQFHLDTAPLELLDILL
ncbi:hypothetical protein IQ06DRAFT_368849 [Phaeosphaeriaceae sp. SRC1lsM3a]|nr:hypothetical protein IQ06DRAFT_368849 [Stagonospora sp. SRC1lsM3a]